MRSRFPAVLLPLLLALSPATSAAVLARQGSFEVPVEPIQDSRTVSDFYSYNTIYPSTSNTGLEILDTSLLFLYQQQPSPGPLSLVVIHDIHDNGLGGTAVFNINGLPFGTSIAVQDDAAEGGLPDPTEGGPTTASWNWSPCCTDGAAYSLPTAVLRAAEDGPSDPTLCISIAPSFGGGITTWQLLSGPTTSVTRTALPTLTGTVYLCSNCLTMSCPPVIDAPCGGVTSGEVTLVAIASSLCGGETVVNDHTAGGADASGSYPIGTTLVTFTLTDAAGFTAACQTQVNVSRGTEMVPGDQGNVLRGVKSDPDAVLQFAGAAATAWRIDRDSDKRILGTTALAPDVTVPSFSDPGIVRLPPSLAFYRLRGLSPCAHNEGPP